jgi:MoaA/NifB/PqqE/SkfB family radical SAM enzyme
MIRRLGFKKYLNMLGCLLKNKMAGESVYPFYASFKLTSRCHFGCKFCNIKDEKQEDMPTARIKRILDNLSASSVILTSFEGGEPLLREDIGELLAYARQKDFYLLFTTSERHPEKYPMKEYAKYIDFFHVSIDEGHNNLAMFERLDEFRSYGAQLSVQVVVTQDTIHALEEKVKKCFEAGANAVVMPAAHMNRTEDYFPDLDRFEKELIRLKKKYPATIYTPEGFFERIRTSRCSTASVIIDSDGRIFYPCHILEEKGPDLSAKDLMEYLRSPEACRARKVMDRCRRQCGWFQYFSIADFTSFFSVFRALKPTLSKISRG